MALIAISDVDVLQNAVRFSTAQRAFAARMVVEKCSEELSDEEIAYLVIEGLGCFVTASEDLLGWVQVLRLWDPSTPETQLFTLLDKVNIGPDLELEVLNFLKGLDVTGVRNLLGLPPVGEIPEDLLTTKDIEGIERALQDARMNNRQIRALVIRPRARLSPVQSREKPAS